jgi:hypothetical protein
MLRNLREGDCPGKPKRCWLSCVGKTQLGGYEAVRLFVEVERRNFSDRASEDHLSESFRKFVDIVTGEPYVPDSYDASPHDILVELARSPLALKRMVLPPIAAMDLVKDAIKRGVIQKEEEERYVGLCTAWMQDVPWEVCAGLTSEHRPSLGTWDGEFWDYSNVLDADVLGRGVSGLNVKVRTATVVV